MLGPATPRRWPIVILAIGAIIVLSKVLVEDVFGLTWSTLLSRPLSRPGLGTAAAIVGVLSMDVLLPVPSSLVMIASGALFGSLTGGCLSLAGSLAGNYVGFEVARVFGRKATERWIGSAQLDRMERAFARHGALAIVASRPLPIVMETLSVAAGLSNMRRSTFLLASIVGTAPVVFLYAYAGAASLSAGTVLPAVLILAAILSGGWAIARALGLRVY
jgi:uncharacterized membrane protein YdjX (TVP38/TMEM64 family)